MIDLIMHEHHQVQKLINEILAVAAEKQATEVTKITVAMGELLGFDQGSVSLYFETLGEGTILEGAEISFHMIPGELHCSACNKDFIKNKGILTCPTCGIQGTPTEKGKEFFAEHIETK